ncbi:MAG: PD-(D/E)XK nuclease family protein, partial [Bacteroidales bacterium]
MTEFKTQLEEIQKEFKQEKHRTEKEFNIFNALYRKDNERFHSRFISYLLSPKSRHGMGNSYLKLFIERLSKTYPNLEKFNIDDCIVLPDEEEKTEHEYIDIYIQNNKMQAIIIENKIYSGDSNDSKKENPEERIQLIRYFKTVEADKKIKDIFVVYLTPDRHNPEEIEKIEMHFPVLKIDYPNEIIDWIDKCIEI